MQPAIVAVDRMRDELERLCHMGNPAQAAAVRRTAGKLLKDVQIVQRPSADGRRPVGELELDGATWPKSQLQMDWCPGQESNLYTLTDNGF